MRSGESQGAGSGPSPPEVADAFQRAIHSQCLAKSARLRKFLQFAWECLAEGRQDALKEYTLGVEVFERRQSFDPRLDPIVRVEANRLRRKLEYYYETEGKDDPLIIDLPRGSYVPVVRQRTEPPKPSSDFSILKLQILAAAAVPLFILVAGLGLRSWLNARFQSAPAEPVRLTSDAGLTSFPDLSGDGRLLAYASDREGEGWLSIWVQRLTGGEPVRLTRHNANDTEPCFSPDGSLIAFRSDLDGGGIYAVPVLGGEPRKIAPGGWRPKFSPDGKYIAYWVRDETWGPGKVFVVDSRGGVPRQVQPSFADAHFPIWAPDSRHLLFCGTRISNSPADEHDWWVTPLDGGPAVKTQAAQLPLWKKAPSPASFTAAGGDKLGSPTGWLGDQVYFSARQRFSESVWSVRIRPGDWTVEGAPRRVTTGAGVQVYPAVAPQRLVFVAATVHVNPWFLPVDATGAAAGEPRRLTSSIYDAHPSVSSDGRVVAFLSERSGAREVWMRDVKAGREMLLAAAPSGPNYPKVSPDGSRVVYRVIPKWEQVLYMVSPGSRPELVCDDCGRPTDWSPDGSRLLFEPGLELPVVRMLEVGKKRVSDVLSVPGTGLFSARFSPDGRWIAFHAKAGDEHPRIFLAPFRPDRPPPREQWIALTDGATPAHNPCWSPNGRVVYYMAERDGFRCIWAVRLDASKHPVGSPFAVRHFHDAQRSLLMNIRANANQVGLSASANGLVFALDEIAGNIWSTRP